MNISLTTSLNNISGGINSLTVGQALTNSNLNKVSSLLGTINTSIDKQKNTLDDISDALGKSRYNQPEKGMGEGFGGIEGASGGRSGIGPTPDNKSPEQKKTEHDLVHNLWEGAKELVKGALEGYTIGKGAGLITKATPFAKAAATAAPVAETAIAGGTAAEVAPAAGAGAASLGLGGAATIAGASLIGGLPGTVGAPWALNKFKNLILMFMLDLVQVII